MVPPEGILTGAAELCRSRRVLSIFDEIQTGLARTGKMFCWQHDGARPDILTLGKALGGGVYPVSACLADEPIMKVFQPGQHGSTFGGNPLGAAVASAALDVLVDEGLAERALALGEAFMGTLRGLPSDKVKVVRGKGLLVALERQGDIKATGRDLSLALMARGILAKDTHGQTVRFAPPLVVAEDTLAWAAAQICEAVEAL